VLVAAPVITLTALGDFPVWAAVIIVVREVGVVALRVFAGARGRSMPASVWAKVKTTLQLVAITLYILPLGHDARGLRLTMLVAAVALTVWTGVQYASREGPWVRAAPAGRGPAR
jgi:CDP-diacylglycerol--glycerol-3-phosphate 3-phosphatidyltransferase